MFRRLLRLVIFGHLLLLGESQGTEGYESSMTEALIPGAPPRVKIISKEDQVAVDEALEIYCEVVGYPAAKFVKWYINDHAVRNDSEFELLNNGNTLRIHRAQYKHDGNYRCTAVNEYGISEDVTTVKVVERMPLKVKVLAYNDKFVLEDSILLVCNVCGLPRAKEVRWYKNGHRISETDKIHLSDGNQILKITGASANDIAVYSCEAVGDNQVNGDSKYITVSQTRNLEKNDGDAVLVPVKVKITSLLRERGHDLAMHCDASGHPSPNITNWYKDDRPIHGNNRIKFLQDRTVLTIDNAVESDSGRYSCVAANKYSGDISAEYVRIPWKIQPLNVRTIVRHDAFILGTRINIFCNISGYPIADEILWFKDQKPYEETHRAMLDPRREELTITDAVQSDAGTYVCAASNQYGGDLDAKEIFYA